MEELDQLRGEIQRLKAKLEEVEQNQQQTTPAVIIPDPPLIPIGGVGGSGGSEYTPPPQPFDLEITEEGGTPDIHVVRRYIPAPETVYEDTTERYFSTYANIYLNVLRYNSTYYISVSQTQGASNATNASWLLWEWDPTNNVFIDRRPKILPLYDL